MSRNRRLVARAALAVMALVASGSACDQANGSNGNGTGTGPTVREETTTTPTTAAPIDITTRPDVITLDYADAVMAELDRVLTEGVASLVANAGPTRDFYDRLNAVYDGDEFEDKQSVYGELAADGVDEFRNPPGVVVTKAERIIRADAECVIFAVNRTFAAFLLSPNPETSTKGFIAWVPKGDESDPAGLNRTPWSVVFDGGTLDRADPVNAC